MKSFLTKRWCIPALLAMGIAFSTNAQIKVVPGVQPKVLCPGMTESFDTGYDKAGNMSWAVTGEAEIVSVNGVDLSSYKASAGLSPGDKLQYVHANICNWTGTLTGTFKLATGGTKQATLNMGVNAYFGNSSALTISVLFHETGNHSVSWDGTMGFCGFWGASNMSITINVQGADIPSSANIYTYGFDPANVGCSQSVSLGTDYIQYAQYEWTVEPAGAVVTGDNTSTTFNISSFSGPGTYVVSLKIKDKCNNSKIYQQPITVKIPDPQFHVDGSVASDLIHLTCIKAKGFTLSSEPFISSSAEYEWVLPPGWKANIPHYKEETVNGMQQYYYKGLDLRNLYVRRGAQAAESGIISLYVRNLCSGHFLVKTLEVQLPSAPLVTLPANIFSCDNTVDIIPDVSGGQAPYTVHWTEFLDGYFEKPTYYSTSSDFSNTFIATKYGNSTVRVNITDANGCSGFAAANLQTLGGYSAENPDVSGWLSGHLNPSQPSTLSSNIVKAPEYNRVYFVEHNTTNNTRRGMFYEFSIDKWVLKVAGINNVVEADNTLKYFRGSGTDHLFYINQYGYLEIAAIDKSTGSATENVVSFQSIQPREAKYGYHIQDINGSLFRVFWKDIVGNLYSQVIVYDLAIGSYSLLPNSLETISEVDINGSFMDVVRYDVDEHKNRIFYFKSDGGFYYQNLDNTGVEIKLNGVFSGDFVSQVSDIDFDTDGNVYFAANGDIYFARFDESDNYLGTYKMETTEGITDLTIKSEARGYFTINRSTNVIYYAGGNGNIYQIFRKSDFLTSNTFGIVKATPNIFTDQVANSLVYSEPHLYYRSTGNQVHNLFYTINAQLTCKPAYMKMASSSGMDHLIESSARTLYPSQIDAPASSGIEGTLFPNPFDEYLTVDVKGVGTGKLELVESTGRTVLIENYYFTPTKINTSELGPGVYFCKITSDDLPSVVFKVIKN